MLNNEQITIIENLCNVSFAIFGIGITLITVVISLIMTKIDELQIYNNIRKKDSTQDVTLTGKIKSIRNYIMKTKRISNNIIILVVISLFTYILLWLPHSIYTYYTIIALTISQFIYMLVILTIVVIYYFRKLKI